MYIKSSISIYIMKLYYRTDNSMHFVCTCIFLQMFLNVPLSVLIGRQIRLKKWPKYIKLAKKSLYVMRQMIKLMYEQINTFYSEWINITAHCISLSCKQAAPSSAGSPASRDHLIGSHRRLTNNSHVYIHGSARRPLALTWLTSVDLFFSRTARAPYRD